MVEAPVADEAGELSGDVQSVSRDEGLRETSLEKLAQLEAVVEGGIHTAGTSSQITDGATGDRLITTARHELERIEGRYALVAMCCGSGLGTGTILERV